MRIAVTQGSLTLPVADGCCGNVAVGGAGGLRWEKAALHAQIWLGSSSGGKMGTAVTGGLNGSAHGGRHGEISAVEEERDQH